MNKINSLIHVTMFKPTSNEDEVVKPGIASLQAPSTPSITEEDEEGSVIVTPQHKDADIHFNIEDQTASDIYASQYTPDNRPTLTPSGVEMHPHHYHASTTNPLDEARWLGFWRKGPRTEPTKKTTTFFAIDDTPSKTPEPYIKFVKPESQPTFNRQTSELSPVARKMMEESREEAANIRSRIVPAKDAVQVATEPLNLGRKIAKPKSRAGRFSDVHMSEFRKMDSIANHPSAFRADPNRVSRPTLKRSRSKTDLDKSGEATLKGNTISATSHDNTVVLTSLKRVKSHDYDTSTAKIASRTEYAGLSSRSTAKPRASERSKSCIGRPKAISRLSTPSKTSVLPQSKSTKCIKMNMASSMTGTGPRRSLFPAPLSIATKTPETPESKNKQAISLKSPSVHSPTIRSILRRPQILYSDDPRKIAAGTHVAIPKGNLSTDASPLTAPATAPVRKHVDFTASIKEKAEKDEMKVSNWSIFKDSVFGEVKRASSKDNVAYPIPVTYPDLRPMDDTAPSPSPVRRKTLGAGHDFTFRAGSPLKFDKSTSDTIRPIRQSDTTPRAKAVQLPKISPTKRKLEEVDESDKENYEEAERPVKRTKATETKAESKMEMNRKTDAKMAKGRNRLVKAPPRSHLPQRNENRSTVLSRARLNYLAMPKHRKV